VTQTPVRSLPGAGLTVGTAEDRSGDEPDPRPLVVQVALPGGARLLGALADTVHAQADERKAGQLALYALRQGWADKPPTALDADVLADALDAGNDLVRRVAAQAAGPAPARISLTLLALERDGLHWVSAGDNALFLLRDGELASLLEPGFPAGATTTAYLGMEQPPTLDQSLRALSLRPDDRLLLCSRAIAAHLGPDEIRAALRFDAQPAAQELVALAAPAAPGRARALVLALAPAPRTPGAPVARRRGTSPRGFPGQPPATPSAVRALRLPRDPVWLAALAATALAAVLAVIALLLHLRPLPGAADTTQAPTGAQPAAGTASPPEQLPPAGSAAELPARPLQYRDLGPAGG
jgi:hypothetical protein